MNAIDAKAEILEVFESVWNETGHFVEYEDVENGIRPSNAPWARVTIRHVDGDITSLPNAVTGKRRYEAVGYIRVSVFAPSGQGDTVAYALADKLLAAYTALRPNACVGFTRQRLNEVSSKSEFSQVNFTADFSYDTPR